MNTPQQSIDVRAVSAWRLSGIITGLFCFVLAGGYIAAACYWEWPLWVGYVLLALAAVITILKVGVIPKISWKRWRYEVKEQEISLMHGIWFKHHTLIPMVRVQHVDTKQGPIMRHYGLTSVTIATAAGVSEIPALADEVAGALRDQIAELARVVDEDV